jgi:hypothetical protein
MTEKDFTYFIETINSDEIEKLYKQFGSALLLEENYKEILQAMNKVDSNMQHLYLRLYEISKDPDFLIMPIKYIAGQLVDECDVIKIFKAIDILQTKKLETIKKMLYVCCDHYYLYKIFHKYFNNQMPEITKQILEENQNKELTHARFQH